MKKYPAHKESGEGWLGDVPQHWHRSSVRGLTKVVSERGRPDLPLLSVYRDFGVVQRREDDENHNVIPEDLSNYKVVRPNNLVLNKMKTWQGSLGVSEFEGIVSPAYIVCRLKGNNNPRFIHRLLRSSRYIFAWKRISYGVRVEQWDMRYIDFKQVPLFLPPREEQDAIIDFLEAQEPEIQKFIANKWRTIELLKEQQAAIINRVVTCGLKPNATLKSSGVNLVGNIPAHWDALPFTKYVLEKADYRGATPEKTESGVFLVTAKNVRMGFIDYEASKEFVAEDSYAVIMRRGLPKIGDILFTTEAPLGNVAIVDREDIALAQRVIRFRMKPEWFDAKFTLLSMMSRYFQDQLHVRATGSTALGIKASKLPELKILHPPLKEQNAIVEYIENESNKIAKAIASAEREIGLIEEYRASLIDAAVTGKIDVRSTGLIRSTDNVVEFPQAHSTKTVVPPHKINQIFYRTVLAAEIVHQLYNENRFGRVKLQKILHLCEYYAEIKEIHGDYQRAAAGPYDHKLMYSIEHQLEKHKWYETKERKPYGHEYIAMGKAGGHRRYYERYWTDEQHQKIQRIIDTTRNWLTLECEIFSTAYAAWNDLIIWGKQPTDEAILREILERWHERKQEVSEFIWRKKLAWMRDEAFKPTGFGSLTASKK